MIADPKPERRIVDPDAEPLDSLPIDVGVCPFCAQRTTHWHPHHVVNRSQGGDDVPENLVWCCPTCHGLLHNRRGGKAFNGRFVSYCRIAVPEVGAYTDGAKFDGWLRGAMPRKIILADEWMRQLCESQRINYDRTSRIIIDAQAGSPILMYVVQFGDSGLLDVEAPEAVPPRVKS